MAFRRILITTGDIDGIGLEVTAKALRALGPQPNVSFIYFRHVKTKSPSVGSKFKRRRVSSLAEALQSPRGTLTEVCTETSPPLWVEEAARSCLKGDCHAMVTAPLSKTSIVAAGLRDIGHTEILARICGQPKLFMGFVGSHFCVVLATGHQALGQAVRQFKAPQLRQALKAALELRTILPAARARRPIALVGMNPHAGEEGLIGEEERWFRPIVRAFGASRVVGPLVPDAAFLVPNWQRYSVYVCPYHDQGLIPFKMIHGFEGGVHLTLGLPFVRTSVDHGTAKDIYGKNRAQHGSMLDALRMALRLSKEKIK